MRRIRHHRGLGTAGARPVMTMRSPPGPDRDVVVVHGPLASADVPELCDRVRTTARRSTAEVIVCDVGAVLEPDARTVEALARVQLTARRLGREIRLRHASARMQELIDFMGLSGSVPLEPRLRVVEPVGQPEEREQARGVEERVERDDPSV
jgi:ABC-type transporter Mla MlaB component